MCRHRLAQFLLDIVVQFLGVFVLAGARVKLLDQTGQVVADLAGKDHSDRIGAVLSDQAEGLAGVGAVDVSDVEGARNLVPHLGS